MTVRLFLTRNRDWCGLASVALNVIEIERCWFGWAKKVSVCLLGFTLSLRSKSALYWMEGLL